MNIIEAVKDENVFRPFLGNKLISWYNWLQALRVLYGLPLVQSRRDCITQCMGRNPDLLPKTGFDTALFLTGRRSGKSRMAAVIGSYEAVLAGHEQKLAKGETGVVAICAPTKWQARIVRDYIRAVFETPLLENEIEDESREGFTLTNGNEIQIMAGDWRTVRGFTLLAAIVDEAAFFGYDEECRVRSDTELIRAIKPALATVGGKLIAITTPYAQKGWCWTQFRKNMQNDDGKTLVWNCPSRVMNPTLPQRVVDDALADDLCAAKAEYLGEFRDDVCEFLPRAVVEAVVAKGRQELLPRQDARYVAFTDLSGGRNDDAAIAIAHRQNKTTVVDLLRVYHSPLNPHEVVKGMVEIVKQYGIRRVTGDNYAAEWVASSFEALGVHYEQADKPKSQLYAELLPRICSKEIELLDNELLVSQIAGLERRTRSGGRDIIDHPPGGHDDLANAVAGVAEAAIVRRVKVGGFGILDYVNKEMSHV
jgi:hypothetical protein